MSLATSNRDGGRTSESGHLRALTKAFPAGGILAGLLASQRGAGANMSVDIAIGDAIIPRSDGTYSHPAWNDAVYNQVIATADVSNPRRDIIVMYIDYGQAPSTGVSNNTNGVVKIKSVAGTPAGSPSDPSDVAIQASVGSGNPFVKLARARVAAGASSITNSVIDDLRSWATPNLGNAAAPQGYLIGGKITTAVASNNLTVAVKTLSGNDPSETEPVYVRINDTVRKLTAALSVTLNAGTNWFALASFLQTANPEVDLFAFVVWNTNTNNFNLAISRINPHKTLYSDFSGTNTNPKYLATTGTAPASTDSVAVCGRFNIRLGASASYNWSAPVTSLVISQPVFETQVMQCEPTTVGWSSMTQNILRYKVVRDLIYFWYISNGTSNSTNGQINFSITAANFSQLNTEVSGGLGINNGSVSSSPPRIYIDPNTNANQIATAPNAGSGSWVGSGTKAVRFQLFYEPA